MWGPMMGYGYDGGWMMAANGLCSPRRGPTQLDEARYGLSRLEWRLRRGAQLK